MFDKDAILAKIQNMLKSENQINESYDFYKRKNKFYKELKYGKDIKVNDPTINTELVELESDSDEENKIDAWIKENSHNNDNIGLIYTKKQKELVANFGVSRVLV